MRRPRNKLQVSTFPFLAVLLCVMGSLLLLLYIMDRRAKIAARYRVAEELQACKKRTHEEEMARKAEWEKAREQLHLSLLDRQNQVTDKAKGVQFNLASAAKKLDAVQHRQGDLQQQLKDEAGKVANLQFDIDSVRLGLQQADKREATAKAELLDAVKELADLERVFQQMKALKEREKETYSVVPYRGKRGDARPPIYVECVRAGVLFHPQKKLLSSLDFTPDAVRGEVERRHGPLALQKLGKDKSADEGPYVLFLVRPDGIASYYKAMSALKGYQLDFGYELVDAGWVLDFSADAVAKGAKPSREQQPLRANDAPPLIAPPVTGKPGFVTGSGQGPVVLPPLGGTPGFVVGDSKPPSLVSPSNGGGVDRPSPPAGNASGPRVDTGIPARPTSFVPINKSAPPVPIATAGNSPIAAPIPGNSVGGQGAAPSMPAVPSEKPSLPGFNPGPTQKPAPAPPLSRVLGNKDFVITVECRGEAVTVLPGGFVYRWTASNLEATDKALAETVANLIARRQASVRPGEPPYRPQIRFAVSPDGLRTYYRAYPLLEPLRVPMTRENVEE